MSDHAPAGIPGAEVGEALALTVGCDFGLDSVQPASSITFCRALNIPARYVFGYIPNIGVPPPPEPMDFAAWFEAYLDASGTPSTRANNVWYLLYADVLQIDFDRDGNISHSMIVTHVGSQPYLTYHTSDHYNRSLRSILASYPRAWYYAHRT